MTNHFWAGFGCGVLIGTLLTIGAVAIGAYLDHREYRKRNSYLK